MAKLDLNANHSKTDPVVESHLEKRKKTATTVIRLKRRRGAALPETLHISPTEFEQNDNDKESGPDAKRIRNGASYNQVHYSDAYLSNLMQNTQLVSDTDEDQSLLKKRKSQISRPIILKRLRTPSSPSESTSITDSPSDKDIQSKKRKNDIVRVVDCLHHEEEAEDDRSNAETLLPINRRKKRTRLSILNTSEVQSLQSLTGTVVASGDIGIEKDDNTQKKKKNKRGTNILSPLNNLVDSELKQYHQHGPLQGKISYIDFLRTAVLPSANYSNCNILRKHVDNGNNSKSSPLTTFLNHACSNGMGTALHGSALWNDIEGAFEFVFLGRIKLDVKDADGRTALDVAIMCGHDNIASIIQRRMVQDVDMPPSNKDDFVYDLYYVDKDEEVSSTEGNPHTVTDESNNKRQATLSIDEGKKKCKTTSSFDEDNEGYVELDNGISYWDKEGDLIIETVPTVNENNEENGFDEDYDSNDEAYEGNDYPEEEVEYVDDNEDDDSYVYDGYIDRNEEVHTGCYKWPMI